MTEFHLEIGESVSFSKTVGETDVYLFAGISGDFAPNHVNEAYMAGTGFGRRIAHGALLVGYMSTCSTKILTRVHERGCKDALVSLGYDGMRFLKPVFLGDTVTVTYTVQSFETEKNRSRAKIEVTNQHGDLVAVAEHLLKWVPV